MKNDYKFTIYIRANEIIFFKRGKMNEFNI